MAEVRKQCRCLTNRNKVSHFILSFHYISRHSPSGVAGEGLNNCSRLVSFLSSSVVRMSIVIVSEFFDKHEQWAAFLDGTCKIKSHSSETYSNRAIELPDTVSV